MKIRDIEIDRKYLDYNDSDIELKAEIHETDDDFGIVRVMEIIAIDSRYDKDRPEHYTIKFNCDWISNQKDQDWIANVIAPYIMEIIIRTRKKEYEYIRNKFIDIIGALNLRMGD